MRLLAAAVLLVWDLLRAGILKLSSIIIVYFYYLLFIAFYSLFTCGTKSIVNLNLIVNETHFTEAKNFLDHKILSKP